MISCNKRAVNSFDKIYVLIFIAAIYFKEKYNNLTIVKKMIRFEHISLDIGKPIHFNILEGANIFVNQKQ